MDAHNVVPTTKNQVDHNLWCTHQQCDVVSGGSDTDGAESLVLHISINIQCTGAIMCAVYFVLYRVDYTLYCTLYRAVGDRIDNNFHSLQYQSWPPYTAQ